MVSVTKTKAGVAAILRNMAAHVEGGDSFGGWLQYTARDGDADFDVAGAYRVGNLNGQGGMVFFGESEAGVAAMQPADDITALHGEWQAEAPDREGMWWIYGDEEFGMLGSNYTGATPPRVELSVVHVQRLGTRLVGLSAGHIIELVPFDADRHKPGFVGVWQKVVLPTLPSGRTFSLLSVPEKCIS